MRFWDSSALVPVIVAEPTSAPMRELASDGTELLVWWATPIECASAVARREREGVLTADGVREAVVTLEELSEVWFEVPPRDGLRDDARRLVRIHELKAADAFQLAAARAASEATPETLPFVTLDGRLTVAAQREGFPVVSF
ncbi:MAG: type II toxin-antitoxin system VapC family toxin [Actinobacteria bacterium]|nr:type II toxin-antitoxin system VapC family toxin [Actinomycetota bacterium]